MQLQSNDDYLLDRHIWWCQGNFWRNCIHSSIYICESVSEGTYYGIHLKQSEIDRMLEINTPDMVASQFPEYTFICAKDKDVLMLNMVMIARIVGVGSVNCDSLKRLFVLKEYQVLVLDGVK